jgi:hypothetical protein
VHQFGALVEQTQQLLIDAIDLVADFFEGHGPQEKKG